MGAKSTVNITRSDAISYILKSVTQASDEQLSSIMEDLYGDKLLYNYSIVDSYKDDDWPYSFEDVKSSHDLIDK